MTEPTFPHADAGQLFFAVRVLEWLAPKLLDARRREALYAVAGSLILEVERREGLLIDLRQELDEWGEP